MVAISILSLAITGPLLIAQKGISSAVYSKDQITASYLAQEAVEYVRNMRDSNKIGGLPWLTGLIEDGANDCDSSSGCTISALYLDSSNVDAVTPCPTLGCPRIRINKPSGLYGYNPSGAWVDTPFRRTVQIIPVGSDNKEVLLSVNVAWNTNLFAPEKSFQVTELLFIC